MRTIKNNNSIEPKDFLLISYNEAAEMYDNYDCIPIMMKVFLERPTIIVVCTQDSASNRLYNLLNPSHYQHVLGKLLKTNGYKLIEKKDASNTKAPVSTKGIRTRVYCRSFVLPPAVQMEQLDLGSFTGYSLYNGAILTKIQLRDYNIAVVNCNLYYQRQGNTGLAKRIEEFNKIVEKFELVKLNTTEQYNIFFCGDLNFRSFTKNNTSSNTEQNIKTLINSYVSKQNNIPRVYGSNEIDALTSKTSNPNEKQKFLGRLLKSYRCFGTQLTYKYKKGQFEKELSIMNNGNLKTRYKEILNIKPNGYFRIPSQSCRILLAKISDYKCIESKVNAHIFPDKSDHKMLSLSILFDELEDSNITTHAPLEGVKQIFYLPNLPNLQTIQS